MNDYVSRQYLLDEYDRQHQGPPGGARKIIEEAPAADVIDRREAIEAACKGFCHPGVRCPDEPCREQTKYLRELPPADVVPVVRCKDCKHHSYDEIFGDYWCEYPGRVRDTTSDGFCEKGEE